MAYTMKREGRELRIICVEMNVAGVLPFDNYSVVLIITREEHKDMIFKGGTLGFCISLTNV